MKPILQALIEALGHDSVRVGADIDQRYRGDWSGSAPANPLAVVLPRSTADVATVLRLCNSAQQSVVPQGGLTGLAGGAIPAADDIALSLERLVGVEDIDKAAATLTVLAGTTLHAVREAADAAGFEFALDLASRGSCQIGGNLATNAGGLRVLQSGTARDQVLGIEAVLADGSVIDSMSKLIKNNTGYDLRHLFIGSEGTLGIITRAVLRLRPRRTARHTALCAFDDYETAVGLLRRLQEKFGDEVGAFELMWTDFFEFGVSASGSRSPFEKSYRLYALVEQTGFTDDGGERFTTELMGQLESGTLQDAVVAQSLTEAQSLWAIREATGMLNALLRPINFDIGLPIGDIGRFVDTCRRELTRRWPAHRALYFGHIGDSNLHITVDAKTIPGVDDSDVDHAIYDLLRAFKGSISAEHGIGALKRPFLAVSRSDDEIRCMQAIKQALDPNGILNPGKLLPKRPRELSAGENPPVGAGNSRT